MPDRGSCLWSAANEPPAVPKDHLHHHAIESLNYQLQKIIQNRGHFPTDEAMIKPLRINKIGVASSCVGPTTAATPPAGPIAGTSSCQAARSRSRWPRTAKSRWRNRFRRRLGECSCYGPYV
jgi:hypothetical protein